jgi:uncharacterized metal-binding protein
MRFGIPLLGNRVAPRCTFADSVLVVTARGRRIHEQAMVPLEGKTWADLATVLAEQHVETLICGGISPSTRESVRARDVAVIDNVAGTSDEILDAVRRERIHTGFGLDTAGVPAVPEVERVPTGRAASTPAGPAPMDCLDCDDRVCMRGVPCPRLPTSSQPPAGPAHAMLDAAWDISLETERTLCRLAEVVYFALEMGYQRVGIGFCVDLEEPAAILARVLRRFFEVVPVCCRVGGIVGGSGPGRVDTAAGTVCDPAGMAQALNAAGSELNVLVGLCVGADCLFNRDSDAPVTTLFVKDKSLANNPIGALYSHYYLQDI